MDISTQTNSLSASCLFYAEQEKSIYNESISFLCVIQGSARVTYRDFSGEMRQGNLILMKKTGEVDIQCHEKTLFLYLFFDYIFFTDQFMDDFRLLECNSVKYPEYNYESVRTAIINLAISHTTNNQDNRFLIQNQIFHLFHLLKADFLILTDSTYSDMGLNEKTTAKLKQLVTYLKTNFMSPITLQDVADYMKYTPQYLSNFFKKYLHCTFNNYLNKLRLDAAVDYLKFRNLSVEQISFLCGFANTSSFHKIFQKEYLTTPEQFAKDYRESFENNFEGITLFTEPSFINDYLVNSLKISTNTPLTAVENINRCRRTVHVSETTPLRPVWKELINLGNASNFENPTFRAHISMMQEELQFHYGRVTNILSCINTYYTETQRYVFNFSKVFTIIDYLLNLELVPFLELGDKAPDIYLPEGRVTIDPNKEHTGLFQEMIPALIESCINYYGFDEVSTWKFELWLRYENVAMTRIESPRSYYNRFKDVYSAVKSLVPDAQVGAPGFNTFVSLEKFRQTLELFDSEGLYPDFISAYIYPFQMPSSWASENDNVPILLTEDPDFFRHKISDLKKICAQCHMEHIPLYITEFSTHIALENYFNDSVYQASFILKQYLENWSQVSVMGYWMASDYATEYPDSNLFLFGGNGLVSQSGIPKSGYHAFHFLSMLGCELIAQDDHYVVTHSIDNRYQVLIYNYAHFIPDFCQHPNRYEVLKYPNAALEEIRPFEITLQLKGLTPGTYKICRYLENAEHGSVLHKWKKLNCIEHLNSTELFHFKSTCQPDMSVFTQQVLDSLVLKEKIQKNEICFLTIDKI